VRSEAAINGSFGDSKGETNQIAVIGAIFDSV
jgi:hypothetical protein